MSLTLGANVGMLAVNDLSRAVANQRAELASVLANVVDSGWFVHGPMHDRFQRALSEYLQVPYVIGVASGTDALELALRAVATPQRQTVITVANAGAYTSCAAAAAGLNVRYADVEEASHTMDPVSLLPLLDESVAAVVVTHLYGRLGNVAAIKDLAQRVGARVIEDCAQSIGARGADGMGGSLADLATFSFYPTKNLAALGDGGAIATADDDIAATLVSLRQYGWTSKYHNDLRGGRNSRLDEMQAGVLDYRLHLLDEGNARRRAIIQKYRDTSPDAVTVLPAEGENHSGHLAVVVTEEPQRLANHMRQYEIATDVHYPVPDHRQPAFRQNVTLPVTEKLADRVLTLPCYPELTESEVAHVASALSQYR